ncbi:tetratricopeptide repeat protein [Myroides sp. LJL119]
MNVKKNLLFSSLAVLLSGVSPILAQDLSQAIDKLDKLELNSAKQILRKLLVEDPNQGAAYYYLGDVYLQQDKVDSARITFNQGLAVKDNGYLNYIGLGQIDLLQGNNQGATLNFAKAQSKIKRRDYDQKLLIANAYLHAQPADLVMARSIAQEVLQDDMQNSKAYMILADADLAQGDAQQAYANYRQASLMQSDNQVAKLALALILQKSGGYESSVQQIQEIISADPSYLQAYKALGDSYYAWSLADKSQSTKLQENAQKAYLNYLDKTGDDFQSELDYAKFLLEINDLDKATLFVENLKRKYPNEQDVNQILAYAYYNNKQYGPASLAFEKILANSKTASAQLYFDLASSYVLNPQASESELSKAKQYYQQALKMDVSLSSSFNAIGVELLRAKKYDAAIDIFQVAIQDKQGVNYPADLYYIGYCSYLAAEQAQEQNQLDLVNQANEYFDKCLATGKYLVEANFYKARVNRLVSSEDQQYYDLVFQSYDAFVNQMKKSTQELDSTDTQRLIEAYNWLGSYYANQGENFKAKECFNITLSMDQNNSYALSTLRALDGM